jgi:transposase InsO family protein
MAIGFIGDHMSILKVDACGSTEDYHGSQCSEGVLEAWVFSYVPPRYLLTDNGAQFAAKFFLPVCRELGSEKVFTTAYHPQTNGQVERFNRTIVNSLRGYVSSRQSDWDKFTGALTFG